MEITTLTHTTERGEAKTQIEIDISTNSKDFHISQLRNREATAKALSISYTDYELNIGDVKLMGKEIELLKDFLNNKL